MATKDTNLTSIVSRLLFSLYKLQRQNRFFNTTFDDVSLSRLEQGILVELDASSDRTISEFAGLFRVDRTTVSRALVSLESKGLIRGEISRENRSKRFSILSSGARVITAFDRRMDEALLKLRNGISKAEFQQVENLFSHLSQALGEPEGIPRKGEARYRTEQRRLTRAFGAASDARGPEDLSQLQFHILHIVESSGPRTAMMLTRELSTGKGTLSLAIRELAGIKYLRRVVSTGDARTLVIEITAMGSAVYWRVHKAREKKVVTALKRYPCSNLAQHVEALERFVSARDSQSQDLELSPILVEEDRIRARAFIVTELVKQDRAEQCPDRLVTVHHHAFMVLRNGTLVGVEQLDRKLQSHFSIYAVTLHPKEREQVRSQFESLIDVQRSSLRL